MCACPTKELVERYLSGDCSSDEREVLEEHLMQCEDCQGLVESTRANMGAGEQPEDVGKNLAGGGEEKTLTIEENERPTESASDATVVSPRGGRDYAKSLEAMIEGYKIVEVLPQGGQAVVYKAVHTATKTNVAIKVLLPALLASERARYYFEREAELIAGLDHPNIVSIRDSGIIHGQYYFVMQYVEGEPLDGYVKARRLAFRERVVLFNKICSAITYAHQQGVMHRDLKFANILVDKRGEPHILDFGLAKAIGMGEQAGENAVATITGQWAGSLTTMSPEQASAQPHLIDVRTDVYSLGVILYHLLTRRYPYDVSGSTLDALRNIQEAEPVRPRQIIPKFNADMEAILLAALAKEREKRYQSAADLQGDIENWLEGRPIRVRSISTMYLLQKIIARHRYTSMVAALLVVIVFSFASLGFHLYGNTKEALKESKEIGKQWAAEAAQYKGLFIRISPLGFASFLQVWQRDGRTKYTERISLYLDVGSKERIAAYFLLDSTPLAKKEDGFRQAFAGDYAWFAEFIIGEHYLRDGNKSKALEAYRSSYGAIEQLLQDKRTNIDRLLIEQVKARLYELESRDGPAEDGEQDK